MVDDVDNQTALRNTLFNEGTSKVCLEECFGTVPYLGTFLTDITMINTRYPSHIKVRSQSGPHKNQYFFACRLRKAPNWSILKNVANSTKFWCKCRCCRRTVSLLCSNRLSQANTEPDQFTVSTIIYRWGHSQSRPCPRLHECFEVGSKYRLPTCLTTVNGNLKLTITCAITLTVNFFWIALNFRKPLNQTLQQKIRSRKNSRFCDILPIEQSLLNLWIHVNFFL